MSKGTPWSDDELNTLFEMKARGKTLREIAEALGRTTSSVNFRFGILGGHSSASAHRPEILQEWPDLPADAFKDIKLKPDPQTTISKPDSRTYGGVGSALL